MTNIQSISTDNEPKTEKTEFLASVNYMYVMFTKWWETSLRIKIEAEIKLTVFPYTFNFSFLVYDTNIQK